MNRLLLCFLFLATLSISTASAQSYAYGFKGGLTTGFQKWERGDRDPLFAYHGIAFIESAPEDNAFALFAQLGYHVKGSAVRYRNRAYTDFATGNVIELRPSTDRYEYKNISLTLGGKQKYDWNGSVQVYYLIGIRGDYTLGTNLAEYDRFRSAYFPRETFVRKFNYGATVGGGFEIPISELISGIIEITINPDFSKQYDQPGGLVAWDPVARQNRPLSALGITNNTIELTVGLRFLQAMEYVDVNTDPFSF